ncbi:MAG: hypothetical protein D6785_12120 [Planctomycetota bacterium]|nr:MAG: hypothetical protein D6785_12120 [Planctomycetota bacterium]
MEHLPLTLGEVGGLEVKINLYAVPGKPEFILARKNLFEGCDGIIFVAHPTDKEGNLLSLKEIMENVSIQGISAAQGIPMVFQYHQPLDEDPEKTLEMARELNPYGLPHYFFSLESGNGVLAPLKRIASIILDSFYEKEKAQGDEKKARQIHRLRREDFLELFSKFAQNMHAFKISDFHEKIQAQGLEVSPRALRRQLNQLIEEGKLRKEGYGKGTVYFLEEKEEKEEKEE